MESIEMVHCNITIAVTSSFAEFPVFGLNFALASSNNSFVPFYLQAEHSKNYRDVHEDKMRFEIFKDNKHKIARHNQRYEEGKVTYKLGLNKYADLLHHEFVGKMNGFNKTAFK